MRARRSHWLPALALALSMLTATPAPVLADDEKALVIAPGHALVIGRSYDRFVGTSRTGDLYVYFRRFDPPEPRAGFSWNGEEGEFHAASVPPGRYQLRTWDDGHVIFTYQPYEPRYTVEVQPGEAVYIGDVITETNGSKFRMKFEADIPAAADYYRQNFVDSGLTFTTRKVRRVRSEAILPK